MLSSDKSLIVGLATATIVYAIYSNGLPTVADIRVGEPGDTDIAAAEKSAAWTAAAVVSGISLLAADPTVFVIGGSSIIGLSWWHRHANEVNPMTGKASTAVSQETLRMAVED